MPGGASSVRGTSAATLPSCIDRPRSVTLDSRAGSTPLKVMNASPRLVRASALPRIAGPAPTTPSTPRSFAASAL
jgi:hypothetical protein